MVYCIIRIYDLVIYFDIIFVRLIGLVGRVFANGPGDLGSIPGKTWVQSQCSSY